MQKTLCSLIKSLERLSYESYNVVLLKPDYEWSEMLSTRTAKQQWPMKSADG